MNLEICHQTVYTSDLGYLSGSLVVHPLRVGGVKLAGICCEEVRAHTPSRGRRELVAGIVDLIQSQHVT